MASAYIPNPNVFIPRYVFSAFRPSPSRPPRRPSSKEKRGDDENDVRPSVFFFFFVVAAPAIEETVPVVEFDIRESAQGTSVPALNGAAFLFVLFKHVSSINGASPPCVNVDRKSVV